MLDSVIRFERRNRLSFPYMDDPDRDDSMFEERQQEARNYLATLVKLSDSFVLLGTKQSETDDSKLAEEMIDSLLQARVDLKRENMLILTLGFNFVVKSDIARLTSLRDIDVFFY